MKLEDLVEVHSTSDLDSHGIDMNQFGERVLFGKSNGYDVYKRVRVGYDNEWLLDIDQVAFVYGVASTTFSVGKIKNKLFGTQRGWTDVEHRGKGLITNIMMFLFNQQDFAIISDVTMSDSGRATWMRLCNVLPVTNYYVVDGENEGVTHIDYDQMVRDLSGNNNNRYIIEHVNSIDLPFDRAILTGGTLTEKFDFKGLD